MDLLKKITLAATLVVASQHAFAGWEYRESTDEMRGTKSKFATLDSSNKVDFAFPYSGGSDLRITLRKRPSDGLKIMLFIYKGQFNCFMGCQFSVKFDDGKVESWSAASASSGSSDVIFVNGESKFLSKLKKAKQLIIEAPFYNSGNKQFKFDVSNLKWD